MLILFPLPDYDSYVTVIDADTVITSLTTNGAQWLALAEADKEVYLRIALRTIEDGGVVPPDVTDPSFACLPEAQALVAVNDLVNGISSTAGASSAQIKRQKVGTLEQEFFETDGATTSTNPIPAMAQPCLDSFGYISPTACGGIARCTLTRS